MQFLTAV